MKKILSMAALLSMGLLSHSQITFEKDYDGGYNDADEGFCMTQTSDGGYIMSGAMWVDDNTWYDVGLMKADENGNLLWVNTYGVGSFNIEVGYAVIETYDGGYWIAGGTDGYTGNSEFWAIRTDENGDTLWTKHYGGDNQDYAYTGIQTGDGGFILAGSSNSFGAGFDDVYMVKTDENGNEQWSKTYGTAQMDYANDIRQTADGGYIIAGSSNMNAYIIKTDENGDSIWTRTYGGPPTDEAFSIQQTAEGEYIVTGKTMSEGAGNYDVWLFKLNSNGDMLWSKTYGGTEKDQGFSIANTDDGGYFITGYTESFAHAGEDSDMYLIRTDSNGDTLWTRSYGDVMDDGGKSGVQTEDGGYASFGYKYVSGQQLNFYLVKMNGDGTVGIDDIDNEYATLDIYPNPFSNKTTIEFDNPQRKSYDLKITDITGKAVRTINNIRDNRIDISRQDLPRGFYTIQLRGEKNFMGRIIISD